MNDLITRIRVTFDPRPILQRPCALEAAPGTMPPIVSKRHISTPAGFVAGPVVYGSDDPVRAVQALRAQAERAVAPAAWAAQHRPG